jgi:hypothetical protein
MRWVWWTFAAIAAYYLLTEHRAHLAGLMGWLPFGLLLLCPLMHVFMHGGHGHGGHHAGGHIPRDLSGNAAPNAQWVEQRRPSSER